MSGQRITDVGSAARVAAALAGEPFRLTAFVLGSGQVDDLAGATALGAFEVRLPILSERVGRTPQQRIVETVVPSSVGGFDLTEVGLETEDGTLYAIAQTPRKRLEVNNGTAQLALEFVLEETSADDITVVIDASATYATRAYVDAAIGNLDRPIITNTVSFPVSTLNQLRLDFEGVFEAGRRYLHRIHIDMQLNLSKVLNQDYAVTLDVRGPLSFTDERVYAVNAITDNATSRLARWTVNLTAFSQGRPQALLATLRIVRYATTATVVSQTVPTTLTVESIAL